MNEELIDTSSEGEKLRARPSRVVAVHVGSVKVRIVHVNRVLWWWRGERAETHVKMDFYCREDVRRLRIGDVALLYIHEIVGWRRGRQIQGASER